MKNNSNERMRSIRLNTGDGYIEISIDVARKWRDEIDRQIEYKEVDEDE